MKVQLLILGMIFVSGKSLQAQNSADAINYVNTYKNLAMAEMQRTGIPASITLAQGIHESEAGTSDLVKRSNNHFGIKCKEGWTGAAVYHDDDSRGECFRSYTTPQDSYKDHSDFLQSGSRYAFLFKLDPTDYEGWAYGLRKAGYATNIHYSQILIKLIKDYNLQQYTLIAMGRMKPSEEMVMTVPGAPPGQAAALSGSGTYTGGGDAEARSAGNGNGQPGTSAEGIPGSSGDGRSSPSYPQDEFLINKTRVVYAKAGVSLLSIADQYNLPLSRLLEFNDLKEEDVLVRSQLLFLQRKRRTGATEFHIVREGETMYDICQSEGIRYQDIQEMNQLSPGMEPAAGEKIWLQSSAPARPRLVEGTPGVIPPRPSDDLKTGQEIVIHKN
jgi:Mannosyl-glycoprotein endo-beta-N-acetylglucosaminidase/LysM domain